MMQGQIVAQHQLSSTCSGLMTICLYIPTIATVSCGVNDKRGRNRFRILCLNDYEDQGMMKKRKGAARDCKKRGKEEENDLMTQHHEGGGKRIE